MGKTFLSVIASVVAWIALSISRGSQWIGSKAERFAADLEEICTLDY